MRLLIIALISLTSIPSSGKIMGSLELRELYYNAHTGKAAANKFFREMDNLKTEQDPVIICYRGMSWLMMASHTLNPFTRWADFCKGKDLIELAINKEPGNVEMRFLRFCIQTNIPAFLSYHSSEETDKKMMIKEWHNITDKDLKIRIRNYLVQSGFCSTTEKKVFYE